MPKSNDQKKTFESHHQSQDGPKRKESPQSIWFALPPMEDALQDNKERVWRDLLANFHGMGLHAEILIARSTNLGRHAATPTSPSVTIAINLDGANDSALNEAILHARMLLTSQMVMKGPGLDPHECSNKLLTTLMGLFSRTSADGVIQDSIEEIRSAHKAGWTPLSRASWCRMDEAGIMKVATINLNKESDPIQFQTVMKKEYGKTTACGRISA